MTLIVPAHNEEDVIERKLENVLALDYPHDQLEVVVASDDSSDATHDIVARFEPRGVRLIHCERGGKVAAQDRAVRESAGEIVAFGDANVEWDTDALRELVAPFADPGRRDDLRPGAAREPGRRHEPGGRLLALRDVAARHASRSSTR